MSPPDPALSHSASHYCTELEDAGWVEIGNGVGGRVFHRDVDPEVIKVTDGDDCYLAFAEYASDHPQECLPKLEIKHRDDQWAVIHIEKLNLLSDDNSKFLMEWWDRYLVARKKNSTLPSPKNWSDFVTRMFDLAKNCGCDIDIKPNNAMQRGSTLVFIDPLSPGA